MKCIKSTILLILWSVICGSAMAQATTGPAARAQRYMNKFDFAAAAEEFKTAVAKSPNDISLKERLARTYVLMDDHVNAEAIYAQIVKTPLSQAVNKLYYGLELRANGKYDEAAKAFAEYKTLMPDDPRAKELAVSADKVKALADTNKIYTIVNLQDQNSELSDMGATFYKGGIVFSSNRDRSGGAVKHSDVWTGHGFYDLYMVKGDSTSGLQTCTNLIKGKQPNRKFHEGSATFSADGKEMFFTRSNYVKSKTHKSKDKIVKLKIMQATWDSTKQKWTNIRETTLNNNEYSVGHPALSKDGKKLYFISDMPGGLGETDLYVSTRDNANNWGPAVNLGKDINTKGREMFPFISDDGMLYFSSDARTGLGGLDVYSATQTAGKWGDVQNIGSPINSKADDFAYIIDAKNKTGYFTSNRQGGKGDDDIYKFTKTGITLCGTVVDAVTKVLLPGSDVKLMDGDKQIGQKTTGEKGEFCFAALPDKSYKVLAVKKEYEQNSLSFTTGKVNQVIQVPLSKIGGFDLSVCVKQSGAGTLIGATVELTNKSTGVKKTCVITADCKCKFELEPNTDYTICASKESDNAKGGYNKPCKDITTKNKVAPASLYETLEMTYLEENMVIKIENLYYDLNKWNIRPDAAIELNKVLKLMQEFPNMEIELSSHTDCRASMKYNDELSAKRAKSCVDYLITNGIPGKRMIAAGYGERKLVNNCACEGNVKSTCTEEQHQANRRTEFKILKVK